jgi:uncharacterized Zn-finger protein
MTWVRTGGPRLSTPTQSNLNAAAGVASSVVSVNHSANNHTSGSSVAPIVPASSVPGGYAPASSIPHSFRAPNMNSRGVDLQLNRVMDNGNMEIDIASEQDEYDDFLNDPHDAARWKALYEDPKDNSNI